MKGLISKLKQALRLLLEYVRDFSLYMKHNRFSPLANDRKRAYYKLIIETHSIEKGLSLNNPKPLFGKQKIRDIMALLQQYDDGYSNFPQQMALGALNTYVQIHRDQGVDDPLIADVEHFLEQHQSAGGELTGGIKAFEFPLKDPSDASALLATRSSCRMFDTRPIPQALLERVVGLAQRAPSQCNRQSSQVHVYQNPADIERLLLLQGGSRGFAESVGNLMVVTSDVAAWSGPGQRNQPYVDGALFAMGLLLAAHSVDLLGCPLNLAITNAVERKIKETGRIPEDERLIMMIAIGYPKTESLTVASSPRRALSEVFHLHTA